MVTTHLIHTLLFATIISALPNANSKFLNANVEARHAQHGSTSKTIYVNSNKDQNTVVALSILRDGTLGEGTVTATGGSGATAVDGMGKPASPDALFSQSALTIAGKHLFVVNAGSNSVSMFQIPASDPLKLRQVGKAVNVPGTFPVTVAASTKNQLVCVGTTGSKAGISCSQFDAKTGLTEFDALRPFELGQTDPPSGPVNTVSHTFFSDDESALFTTVKGVPPQNKTGFLSSFPVTKDCTLSTEETRSSPKGTAVLFGSQVIARSNPPKIFATDASFGAAILSVDSKGSAELIANQSIADQMATCWVTISDVTETAFVTDVGVNRIVEMSTKDASIVSTIDLRPKTTDPGLIDLRSVGGFVYALSPGNGTTPSAISVVNVKSKELMQHKELTELGVGPSAMGMAAFAPKSRW